ncbi:SET domain-containing protein [Artomyces pyxidatus]|uniref:SET domain-containing protein n=1 Tax=Artomyces pyxidatus TaxID=48021 RepID=A0ACB8TAN1_9AGAM|nr:SET domain-containing protein [Artomyces pyxidatus]
MNPALQDRRWRALLVWLESLGMQVDAEHLLRLSPLFTLPGPAKINLRTLQPHYPSRAQGRLLSATQLVSLHLSLYRPASQDDSESPDPFFGPYVSVLPREFDSHPLTWLVKKALSLPQTPFEARLPLLLPPGVLSDLTKVETRFWEDWQVVSNYVEEFPKVVHSVDGLPVLDFLWAWLNVNTRCLYDDLGLDRADNHSMCPIFDFANHAWMQPTMKPIQDDCPPAGVGELTCISGETSIAKDEELYITYGAHPNRFLFVEYGFVNPVSEELLASGQYFGEADVQALVEEMILGLGTTGVWMKQVLQDEGYWGDWTLHSAPEPAHPSYRLITALRLYHLVHTLDIEEQDSLALQPWRDTLSGTKDDISEENERVWRNTVLELCQILVNRAELGLQRLQAESETVGGLDWFGWMVENIRLLWWEEREVALAVARSIRRGETF